ncbi:MAG: DUF6521 family protein [Magnetococcus sp. MYC-9]
MIAFSELPRVMHNPALGAVVLHSFVQGWEEKHISENGLPWPLLFLPLPLVLHMPTAEILAKTQQRSGLIGLTEGDDKLRKNIYSFQERVLTSRKLSMESMVMALATGLLILDLQGGQLFSGRPAVPRDSIPERVRLLVKAAKSLGRLCQGHSLGEISFHLRVQF